MYHTDDHVGWTIGVKRAMIQGNVLEVGAELLQMAKGFRVLPVTKTKAPIRRLVPHGVNDATDDPVVWQQWIALWPDAGLGVVPGDGFAIIDDDGALDLAALGIPKRTFTERTRRGRHAWVRLPLGTVGRRAKLAGGDLLSGYSGYAVMSPTPGYAPIEVDAPIVMLPETSPLRRSLVPHDRPSAIPRITITPGDRVAAERVKDLLLHDRFGAGIAALYDGTWRSRWPGWTVSERDFMLALCGTHFTTDAAVLAALIEDSAARRGREASAYIARTVAKAIAERERRHAERRAVVTFRIAQEPERGDVLYGTPPRPRPDLSTAILNLITETPAIEQRDGFVRVPVADIAAVCGVNRKTVQRAIGRLEKAGRIETRIRRERTEDRYRCTRWARLTP